MLLQTLWRPPNCKRLLKLSLQNHLNPPICCKTFQSVISEPQTPELQVNEKDFVKNTLSKHGIFNSHLYRTRPFTISRTELDSLSTSFNNAVSQGDVLKLLELGEKVPSRASDVDYMRKHLEASRNLLFDLMIGQYLTESAENLENTVDNQHVLQLVEALFRLSWLGVNQTDTERLAVAALEKAMLSHHPFDISTWCRFMQWRLTIEPERSALNMKFLRDIAPTCQSTKDVIAVSTLLGPLSEKVKYDKWHLLEHCFADVALRNPKIWYDNEELMGVLCFGVYEIYGGRRLKDRRLITLIWDVIVHNMKRGNNTELSTASRFCIRCVGNSMHKAQLKDYPYMLEKCFSSLDAIHTKLIKVSPETGVLLFNYMLTARHVNVPVANRCLQGSVGLQWTKRDINKISDVIYAAASYGCMDAKIYNPMLQVILSPEYGSTLASNIPSLLKILCGLCFIHIFPQKLLAMLFEDVQKKGCKHFLASTNNSLSRLLFLDGTLPILCPGYKGPRLDEQVKKRALAVEDKGYLFNRDGSPTVFSRMVMTAASIESLPTITERYIVQRKPALAHFPMDDIVLTTTDPSASNVVIVNHENNHFYKLFNSSWNSSLQLTGLWRSKNAQLEKLGFTVVSINYDEYLKSLNHSQLLIDKLKAAQVL